MEPNPDTDPAAESARRTSSVELKGKKFAIFLAVDDLRLERGYGPTLREIAERVGWTSTGAVSNYLKQLRSLDLIEGRGRSLRVRR